MKTAWTQTARGRSTIDVVSGTPHCGRDDKPTVKIAYRIYLEYPEGVLDSRGFLMDNLFFSQYFADLRRVETSCERMAELIARQLCEVSKCHRITVELSSVLGIWIGFTLNSDRYPG